MQTRLMAIGPEETHRSTRKGEIMSATRYRIMLVELDEDCADTGAQLEAVLEQCQKERVHDYYKTATFGTATSCASDRFYEIAESRDRLPR